jgi:L-threonylcarbamoyladenylate synthase
MSSAIDDAISHAVELLQNGEPVIVPTETVYGLAANAFDADAVAKVFRIKGRPANNPLIVHVVDRGQLTRVIGCKPTFWEDLVMKEFWPGPLSIVFKAAPELPSITCGGLSTVAVRCPEHPTFRSIIGRAGPLAAPSANKSERPSPTTTAHVLADYQDHPNPPFVVPGEPSHVGLESTVIILEGGTGVVLRPGGVSKEQLQRVLPQVRDPIATNDPLHCAPGTKHKHYMPETATVHMVLREEIEKVCSSCSGRVAVVQTTPSPLAAPANAALMNISGRVAESLFETLRRLDRDGYAHIVFEEAGPSTPLWEAINDRLARAAGKS